MRRIIMAIVAAISIATASAQEITSYDVDSTSIYNSLNNPNDFSQAPTVLPKRRVLDPSRISTNVWMGTSFSNIGSSQYVSPSLSYQATDRLRLQVGMGIMHTNLNLSHYAHELLAPEKLRTGMTTSYVSASAIYQVSPRCDVYGSIIYASNMMEKPELSPYLSKDRYMATFGATFNITQSLSIGIEVRNSKNMGARYMFHDPYHGYGF